jgi:hypothetical protein
MLGCSANSGWFPRGLIWVGAEVVPNARLSVCLLAGCQRRRVAELRLVAGGIVGPKALDKQKGDGGRCSTRVRWCPRVRRWASYDARRRAGAVLRRQTPCGLAVTGVGSVAGKHE